MVRPSRVLVVAFLVLGAASSASSALAEELKIGYVDKERALSETDDGRKAKAQLKKEFDQKQKELDEQQADLKKAIEDLDKKRTLLPADKVREKETELQARMQRVQQTYLRHQQDLAAKEQEALGKISERMNRIIAKIAAAEKFTFILEKGAVAYGNPYLDVTADLIQRYNRGEGTDGGARAPATAATPAPKPKK